MAVNRMLPFAVTDTGTNLLPQAEYESDNHRFLGHQPGVARSTLLNKTLRQSSLVTAAVAQFMADHALEGDADVSDDLSLADMAAYFRRSLLHFLPAAASSLPDGGEPGQAIVMGENGPEWQFVSGVPLGQLTFLPYDEAPPGFVKISYQTETVISLAAFPQAVKFACPAGFNDEADFFYRATYADGSVRHADGPFLVLPAASRYFFRGFDEDGGVGQYRYEDWSTGSHAHYLPVNSAVSAYANEWDADTYLNSKNRLCLIAETVASAVDNGIAKPLQWGYEGDSETRPMNIGVFRVFIRLWDAADVPSSLDVQALVNHWSDLSAHRPDMAYLDGMTAVLYPNGGTAEEPAEVKINQRIVMENPFPGYHVSAEVQVEFNGNWSGTGWYSNEGRGYGVDCHHWLGDDSLVMVSGNTCVLHSVPHAAGHPFSEIKAVETSRPCRVVVTRLGRRTV